MDRRSFISVAAATTGLTGCLSNTGPTADYEETDFEFLRSSDLTGIGIQVRGGFDLRLNEFCGGTLNTRGLTTIYPFVIPNEGAPEFHLFEASQISEFKSGGEGVDFEIKSGETASSVPQDEYAFVIENTSIGSKFTKEKTSGEFYINVVDQSDRD